MKNCVTYIMLAVYGVFNLFGHAGLHVLLGDNCSAHQCSSALIFNNHDVNHSHKLSANRCSGCCHHVHVDKVVDRDADTSFSVITHQTNSHGNNENQPFIPVNGETDDECQLGLYFAQSQIEVAQTLNIEQLLQFCHKAQLTSQIINLLLCSSYDVRGPPLVFCA